MRISGVVDDVVFLATGHAGEVGNPARNDVHRRNATTARAALRVRVGEQNVDILDRPPLELAAQAPLVAVALVGPAQVLDVRVARGPEERKPSRQRIEERT